MGSIVKHRITAPLGNQFVVSIVEPAASVRGLLENELKGVK